MKLPAQELPCPLHRREGGGLASFRFLLRFPWAAHSQGKGKSGKPLTFKGAWQQSAYLSQHLRPSPADKWIAQREPEHLSKESGRRSTRIFWDGHRLSARLRNGALPCFVARSAIGRFVRSLLAALAKLRGGNSNYGQGRPQTQTLAEVWPPPGIQDFRLKGLAGEVLGGNWWVAQPALFIWRLISLTETRGESNSLASSSQPVVRNVCGCFCKILRPRDA